ncbi:MAG: molecular chaperone DnaK [Spirochaetaceae bacterium]|nr:MAG: molecular chaperone DnaK [Spirochaetaceae bacterium]
MTVGIDLGTTNSLIGIVDDGRVLLVPNRRGHVLTPSVIGIDMNGEVIVGEAARNQAVSAPGRTLHHIKRHMGERLTLPLGDEMISPEEGSAAILRVLRQDVARYTGGAAPESAVITVPAHFDDRQRNATVEAGLLAGFRHVRLLNEPTAAALPYAARDVQRERILVFDFGGGTLDVTCLEREGDEFHVAATVGDGNLGGVDIDGIVLDRLAREVEAQTGLDVTKDPTMEQMLRNMAETAKTELSDLEETTIAIPFVAGSGGMVHISVVLTRAELEDAIAPVVNRAMGITDEALRDAGLKQDGFDTLVLAGGSSRLPVMRRALAERFPVAIASMINPEEIVAVGATQLADSRRNGRFSLHDVVSGTLALELADGTCIPIVHRNQTIPARRTRVFTTVADDQVEAEIHLLQGDRPRAAENRSLGKFLLSGLEEAERGSPRIAVTVEVNADGVVTVHAGDEKTGSSREMVARARPRELKQPIRGDFQDWLRSLARRGKILLDHAPAGLAAEVSELVALAESSTGSAEQEYAITVLETLLLEITARAMIRGDTGGARAER